jgi:hypothetical protein
MKTNPISPKKVATALAAIALAAACEKVQPAKEGVSDTTSSPPIISANVVNQGAAGMTERVSWTFSPDRRALLVVVDPAGVEAEPVPNAFFFGDERTGFQVRMDSVWDAAVSPDWKSIAFSRAFTLVDGSGQSDPARLTDLSRKTGIDTATLRSTSFASSGMSGARSIAQVGVVRVPDNPRSATGTDSSAPKMFPIADGWRVRWTSDGSLIAVGRPPTPVLDAQGSESWATLDPRTGELHGSLPSGTRMVEPAMTQGPVLHGAAGTDVTSMPAIKAVRGGQDLTIVSERGVITISAKSDSTGVPPRVVGAGVALAATADAGYVIALVPKTKVQPGEGAVDVVVYRVSW